MSTRSNIIIVTPEKQNKKEDRKKVWYRYFTITTNNRKFEYIAFVSNKNERMLCCEPTTPYIDLPTIYIPKNSDWKAEFSKCLDAEIVEFEIMERAQGITISVDN